jgi:multidrug efflux pump subunit AcrB
MFANFFIDRPRFAAVLSILTLLIGGLALTRLPIAQYPEVAPPTVQVTAVYPGADAKTVAETVATPIEAQVNGVQDMLYMSSKSGNDGNMNLTVTFKLGTDLDIAQVLVQNRVSIALSNLPEEVRRQGVTTLKKSPNILLVVHMVSPDDPKTGRPRYDTLFLSNYAYLQVKDELARLEGVGDVTFLGQRDYSMRLWLDPSKLTSRGLMAGDVIKAVQAQNVQVAAGRLGQPPVPPGQAFQLTINAQGRLVTEEQFGQIVVKADPGSGAVTYLRDVVRDRRSRVRLDPGRLAAHGLGADDVFRSLDALRVEVRDRAGDAFTLVTAGQRVEDLPVGAPGKPPVALVNLARDPGGVEALEKGVELGAKNYEVNSYIDGQPCVSLAVYQLPGSNALDTAKSIRSTMERLKASFPEGVEYRIVYDTTRFVEESVTEVVHTLFEAFVLVFVVVLVFLQTWRATVIPMVAVPVSLVGTLAVMWGLGFSLNNLSLFGLVLAIGIVVDDAIVVVENVERNLGLGLGPRDATRRAMTEVSGPVIAVALVLCAVFVPTAIIPGITGQFFRQFALTIATATVLSAFNSLTLSPALSAILLKPHGEHGSREAFPKVGIAVVAALVTLWVYRLAAPSFAPTEGPVGWVVRILVGLAGAAVGWLVAGLVNLVLGYLFRAFNWGFDRSTDGYGRVVRGLLGVSAVVLLVYAGLLGLTYFTFTRVPIGFIPEQDKQYLVVNAQLPDGAALDRTDELMRQVGDICRETPGVGHTVNIPGYSILTSSNISNTGGMYVVLKPFEDRHDPALHASRVAADLRQRFAALQAAQVVAFGAPPVDGLGSTGGFKLQIQDRGNLGLDALQGATDNVIAAGNRQPGLVGLFTSFRSSQPQLFLDIDRVKAMSRGVGLTDVFQTLQANLGSAYVNDFTFEGRNWQVNVQADARYRERVGDVGRLRVRGSNGDMVPLATLLSSRDISGPALVNHYNLFPSAEVSGNTRPGTSSGQAITLMDQIAGKELPQRMGSEWSELSLQQILAAQDPLTVLAFPLGVICVFLFLAAQYESWSLPLAIILIVPMCILCALIGVALTGGDNNIFTQIGLVVLVGLAAKNAILIVEFAKQQQDQGKSRWEAAVEASRLRLRPILMTSFAFILGVVPLAVATGAGAEMRRALGIAVFSGMLGVTVFGLFLTPVFYVVIRRFTERAAAPAKGATLATAGITPGTDGTVPVAGTDGAAVESPLPSRPEPPH